MRTASSLPSPGLPGDILFTRCLDASQKPSRRGTTWRKGSSGCSILPPPSSAGALSGNQGAHASDHHRKLSSNLVPKWQYSHQALAPPKTTHFATSWVFHFLLFQSPSLNVSWLLGLSAWGLGSGRGLGLGLPAGPARAQSVSIWKTGHEATALRPHVLGVWASLSADRSECLAEASMCPAGDSHWAAKGRNACIHSSSMLPRTCAPIIWIHHPLLKPSQWSFPLARLWPTCQPHCSFRPNTEVCTQTAEWSLPWHDPELVWGIVK